MLCVFNCSSSKRLLVIVILVQNYVVVIHVLRFVVECTAKLVTATFHSLYQNFFTIKMLKFVLA